MTPRLWEYVFELQKQAKLKDNVVFSAQGAPKKSLGTSFHVKLKNKVGPLSSLFFDLGLKNAKCKIEKSEESRPNLFFNFT